MDQLRGASRNYVGKKVFLGVYYTILSTEV